MPRLSLLVVIDDDDDESILFIFIDGAIIRGNAIEPIAQSFPGQDGCEGDECEKEEFEYRLRRCDDRRNGLMSAV